jgi:hypothetical protein
MKRVGSALARVWSKTLDDGEWKQMEKKRRRRLAEKGGEEDLA